MQLIQKILILNTYAPIYKKRKIGWINAATIYFDMNVYRKKSIKKYSLRKSIKQIQFIKSKNIPVYIGGGIDKKNVSNILKQITPFGLDISRSLKNQRNLISKSKLKDFLNQISVG